MAGSDEPDEPGRLIPPAAGPELDTLNAFLDFHRFQRRRVHGRRSGSPADLVKTIAESKSSTGHFLV
jgi:hypothetical protein